MATKLTLQTDMAAPSFTAADSTGNTFDNGSGQVFFWVKNESASAVTVTVTEQRTCSFGHAAQNFTASVGAGLTSALGPFDIMRFNSSSLLATATCSPVASVSVAAVEG
jgi:hypothetical protein